MRDFVSRDDRGLDFKTGHPGVFVFNCSSSARSRGFVDVGIFFRARDEFRQLVAAAEDEPGVGELGIHAKGQRWEQERGRTLVVQESTGTYTHTHINIQR